MILKVKNTLRDSFVCQHSCVQRNPNLHHSDLVSHRFLLQLPTIIADNAGYDSADLVAQLRAAHQENKTTFGLSE